MQNRSRADKADARNDLRRYAGMVAAKSCCQLVRKHREHGGAEADEHIGSQAGRLVMEFPLQPDDAAQDRCHNQPQDRGGKNNRHLLAEHFDSVLNCVHVVGWNLSEWILSPQNGGSGQST